MSRSEQLEREAEQRRAQIADTLAELRSRMTPGEVVDQLMDYARNGSGGQFVHNLQRQVVANPLPLTLVGAGLAWLMMGTRTGTDRLGGAAGRRATEAADDVRTATGELVDTTQASAQSWTDSARASAGSTLNEVREGAGRIGSAAQAAAGRARDVAGSAYETGADTAGRAAEGVRRSTAALRGGAAQAGQSLMATLKDQPLVLAGIGLAIGAAIAAALPVTEAENRMMGEASDDLAERAKELADEQADKAQAVGERSVEAAGEEAGRQGLGTGDREDRATAGEIQATPAETSRETEGPALVPANDADTARQNQFDLSDRDRDHR